MIVASVEIGDEDRADFERDWAIRRSDVKDGDQILSTVFMIRRRQQAEEGHADTAASVGG
jgi:hypothetical protein